MKHGIGKMIYKSKEEYYGYWENGKKHREGVFKYANKDIYSGSWKLGKKDGKGTYIFSETNQKFIGDWKADKFVKGKWIFPNGTYFEGEFENNMPKGNGQWHLKNDNVVEGAYDQKIGTDETEESKGTAIKLSWASAPEIATIVNP